MSICNNLKFPRKSRLLNRQNFKQVFDNAKKFSCKSFVVLITPNNLGYPRLGVVLSKKKISLAVQRNRIRRLIRESFRQQTMLGGMDIVVLAKSGADAFNNATLQRGLIKEWQKCASFLNQL